jgi:hypothetical protein
MWKEMGNGLSVDLFTRPLAADIRAIGDQYINPAVWPRDYARAYKKREVF